MFKVRVTRLIEIEYESFEHYEEDLKYWSLPANGTVTHGSNIYRTATTLPARA